MAFFTTSKIKSFLSAKKTTWAILLLITAGRVIQLLFFYNIRSDASYQTIATQNLIAGHGISITKVAASNLSAIIYEPLINWPPGFSILLAPFYVLFNNYIAAGIALSLLSAFILIFFSRGILKLLDTPLYIINSYTLLSGFYIYYFYFITCSDAVAISFFTMSLYYTVSLLQSGQYNSKKMAGILIPLFICASIKYLFIPVVFAVPVFLFIKGIADKSNAVKKAGILSFIILALAVAGMLIWQKMISGSAVYISEPARGFFPENLKSAYPVFPSSFIKEDTLSFLFSRQASLISAAYHWIYLLFLPVILFSMVWQLCKRGIKKISAAGSFICLSFFISAIVILLLSVLSVRVAKEHPLYTTAWTYAEEPRYYGMVTVLFHLCLFALYFYRHYFSAYLRYLFYFFILLMLPDMCRGIFFTAQRVKNFRVERYSWQHDYAFQQYADSIIQNEKHLHPVDNMVVTGSFYYLNNRVSIYNHIPVLEDAGKINDLTSINTKKPTLLLIILDEKNLAAFQPFLSKKENELKGQFDNYYFYMAIITPH